MVTIEDACRSITGVFTGIDEDGALLLAEPGRAIRKVVAGDLVRGPRPIRQP
jgi:biotin-(acetyl-CoA carboxylase) ligase